MHEPVHFEKSDGRRGMYQRSAIIAVEETESGRSRIFIAGGFDPGLIGWVELNTAYDVVVAAVVR